MKKILAFCIAAAILLSAVPAVFAETPRVTGINAAYAWGADKNFGNTALRASAPWDIPIGFSSFQVTPGTTLQSLKQSDFEYVSAVIRTDKEFTNSDLVTPSVVLLNPGQAAVPGGSAGAGIVLRLARTGKAVLQDMPVKAYISLLYTPPAAPNNPITAQRLVLIEGTVQADSGSLTGIGNDNAGRQLQAGSDGKCRLDLPDTLFTYVSGTPTGSQVITNKKVSDYGISVSSSNNNVKASLDTGGSKPVIVLTTTGSGATEVTNITVTGSKNGMANKSGTISNIYIDTAAAVIPAASSRYVSGISSGSSAPVRVDSLGSNLTVGQKLEFRLSADQFTWSGSSGTQVFRAQDLETAWISGYNAKLFDASYSVSSDGKTASVILTAKASSTSTATMKIALKNGSVSTQETGVTISSISNPAPITGNKITGIRSGAYLGGNITVNDKAVPGGYLDIRPGDVLRLHFNSDFFTWQNGAPSPAAPVTSNLLSNGNIRMNRSNGKNATNVIESIELVARSSQSYIEIKFAEQMASTSEKDFSLTVFFSLQGTRHTDSQVILEGMVSNYYEEVFGGESYMDISDGTILKADSLIRNIELYIGDGVTLYTNLISGKKYYATARMVVSGADEEVIEQYPSIEIIYQLKSVGINTSAPTKVSFDLDGNYYVYAEDGKYLGTSKTKLPYSNKYYLSTKRVAIGSDDSGALIVEEVEMPNDKPTEVAPPEESFGNGFDSGSGNGSSGNMISGAGSGGGLIEEEVPLTSGAPLYNPHNGSVADMQVMAIGLFLLLCGLALFLAKEP